MTNRPDQQVVEEREPDGSEVPVEVPESPSEVLGDEVTPENFSNLKVSDMPEVRKSYEAIMFDYAQNVESHEVAETVGQLKKQRGTEGLDRTLNEYFTEKQKQGLFDKMTPQELSAAVLRVEGAFMADVESQIDLQFLNLNPVARDRTLCSMREVLYSTVMSGTFSPEKLEELFKGSIVFKKAPDKTKGGEAEGETYEGEIFGYFNFANGKATLYFYEPFVNSSSEAQASVLSHEMAHPLVEAGGIWDHKVLAEFWGATKNPTDAEIANFKDHPELSEILKMLQNPQMSSLIWGNHYIRERLQGIGKLSAADQPGERTKVAKELMDEMVAYHLRSGSSEESYLARRFKLVDKKDLESYILQSCGVENFEALGIRRDMTPVEMREVLAKRPELSALFQANTAWHQRLTEAFANKGAKLSFAQAPLDLVINEPEYYDGDDEDFDLEEEMVLPEGASTEIVEGSMAAPKMASPRSPKPPKGFLMTIFELVTGQPSTPEIKK